MLPQIHMMGEGVIGRAAFTGKHRWLFSDAHDSISSFESQDIFQDDSDFGRQFSSGIKTIAVISVVPQGVVQFGSTQKILERLEFLDQTKRLFRGMENVDGLIPLENGFSSLNNETYDLNGLFSSFVSSGNSPNGDLNSLQGDSFKDLMGEACLATNLNQSSHSFSAIHDESMAPLLRNLAHPNNQLQTGGTEAQVLLSDKLSAQFHQVFLQSTSSVSTRSSEDSILTSFDPLLASETRVQDSRNVFNSKANTLESCRNKASNVQESTYTSAYSEGGLIDVGETIQEGSRNPMDSLNFCPSILETATSTYRFPEQFKPVDFTAETFEFCLVDDLSQWFSTSPEHSISGMVTALSNGLSQSIGATSASSCLIADEVFNDFPIKHLGNSVQSSVTNTFNSDVQENPGIMHGVENDLFDCLGADFGHSQSGECWEDLIMPVVSAATDTGMSECISEMDVGSGASGPRKGLFSELGLQELLDGISNSNSFTKSSFEDQLSTTKKSRVDISSVNSNQLQLASLACSSGGTNIMRPVYNLERKTNATKKEVLPKSQVGLWIDDSYSINVGNASLAQPQKPEEPAKATRKRARPGESTRPRPKDRQQIQDRIKELRGIIPHGGKCSIDSLLDRTIKYMLFLQSVTKYADELKQSDEPKLIGQETGVVLKDNSMNGGSGGTTWAFEVGSQTMVCPIIVEDLNPPGQMLIEMLCEERGFFLEIADVIRGFQLNILKGVMEARDDKIWARFIVEASSHVTRIDIFLSLVQLLKQTTSGNDTTNQPSNTMDGVEIRLLDCYQKPTLPCPISLAETLGC
ncbi:hypothetical protein FH972_011948 [Carpinus fangiana]|nr:hypothetical protein FH972_011948 [Carpinus fangiana]KAE8055086.1 hypothetical protein FH972_011948 [Carpinus fangiana]